MHTCNKKRRRGSRKRSLCVVLGRRSVQGFLTSRVCSKSKLRRTAVSRRHDGHHTPVRAAWLTRDTHCTWQMITSKCRKRPEDFREQPGALPCPKRGHGSLATLRQHDDAGHTPCTDAFLLPQAGRGKSCGLAVSMVDKGTFYAYCS
jgi:hypothetical protein